jgi:hypothetical protein
VLKLVQFSLIRHYTVIFLVEIRLKTVERAQLNFRHGFWSNIVQVGRNFSKLAEIRPMVGFFCADLGEIRPVWKNFDQLVRYPTKIGGGNSTARVRPFLNEFRPKKLLYIFRFLIGFKHSFFGADFGLVQKKFCGGGNSKQHKVTTAQVDQLNDEGVVTWSVRG